MCLVDRLARGVYGVGPGVEVGGYPVGVPPEGPCLVAANVNDGELALVCPPGGTGQHHAVFGKARAREEQVHRVAHIGYPADRDDVSHVCIDLRIGRRHRHGKQDRIQADEEEKRDRQETGIPVVIGHTVYPFNSVWISMNF